MKLLVSFSRKKVSEPIIARVVRDTGVLINVERARIEPSEGKVLIDVPDESARLISEKMRALGAAVEVLEHAVMHDDDECVDCGACVSVCPQEVFSFDEEWKLTLDQSRCVLCGRCVQACPHGALTVEK
ncbi:4Fe-4S dicluster domain-containing protein [Methanofollis aquaemaris]|uniref:4Fe-4S dicluster domain-containing protein n=1 Tax=Methanofollis aquaemaris TaxID=126734 RepID=A0A8A3S353_9EURY|nr:4Fe-4S binding protein [Methanofollis aquaemaris]QSZ66044.1 4Fe-4S dicluster domain-containing protein [Methanofollis aquaemaris]